MEIIEKIKRSIPDAEFGAMLLTSPVNRFFATGFASSAGALFITADDAWFFTDSRYIEAAEAAIPNARVRLVTKDETYAKQIGGLLSGSGIETIGFEDGHVTYAGYLEWDEKLPAKLKPARQYMDDLRAVKSNDDLEKMKKAQRIAEKSFGELLPSINKNITEKQLATSLINLMAKNGADDKSFDPIIVSGVKSSMPHGVPGEKTVSDGFLTIDFGAKLDGWCSDTTRTLCVGAPSGEMVKIYDTVLAAQEAGIKAARAGVRGCDVDAAARAVIEQAGYGEYFGHGFGHGLGLEVHEPPNASQIYEKPLPAGAVISAEPGIYLPGKFGVRIEDVIFIKEDGCENITNLPKGLIVL